MGSHRKRHAVSSGSDHDTPRKTRKQSQNTMSPGRIDQNDAHDDGSSDVVVVGAGPAGLMLAANLVRFGIKTTILDNRPDKTSTGRADGLQPKTIETLKQMRLATSLLEQGVKFYDICFWSSSPEHSMQRTGREAHYPPVVDLLDPYMILVHQGMVEEVFLDDLAARGVEVQRNSQFLAYESGAGEGRALKIEYLDRSTGATKFIASDYLVGCDGAHSQVRKSIPNALAEGSSSDAIWGVLDGELVTDFPDLWSKAVIYSHKYGNILCIPRERNMTRFYIELKSEDGESLAKERATQEYVMDRARQILQPYRLDWTNVEWFGIYQIGQRVANMFTDDTKHVFIAGDASHTHSPKAAQGMNTSMHDSLNLAWKLNLQIRGLAREELLLTYEDERRKIAQDLINFDYEHANAFHDGDPSALARNFSKNIRFISGVGAEYGTNLVNHGNTASASILQLGALLPPAKVTRYIDANPVDIQLDIPMLGQFRIYFICPDLQSVTIFLEDTCKELSASRMITAAHAARISYTKKPRSSSVMEEYVRPERYLSASNIFTPALVTATPKAEFELAGLPELLQAGCWTVYLDDQAQQNSNGKHCFEKWIGDMISTEIAIAHVRPDGYVGKVDRWDAAQDDGVKAAACIVEYYSAFLNL